MKTINNKMLVLARESRGLTQAELTKKLINISQANYSRMEKGLIEISESQIEDIAKSLDFPRQFFSNEKPIRTESEYLYRKQASLPKKEQYKLEANFSLLRFWFNAMLEEIDIPEFSLPEIQVEHTNTPERIARIIRLNLEVSSGPIDSLVHLLERSGIVVYSLEGAPAKFDGTTIISTSGTRIIVLNADMPNYRKRFTIAHELGHIICHIPFSNYDSFNSFENEANRFAAEFLMPEEECLNDLLGLTYAKLTDLKNYWNVSKSAIIRRALDLGCISRDKYTYLMIELSRYGERRAEKTDVSLDSPKILKMVINSFMSDLAYSKNELMDALSISEKDFERFLDKNEKRLKIVV